MFQKMNKYYQMDLENIYMNKHDLTLILIFLVLVILCFITIYSKKKDGNKAVVYYEDQEILTIDLKEEEKEYIVEGFLGEVKILAGNGRIKVVEENSPNHLCSKQGYISSSYQTITCLPNKIVIEIKDQDDLDTVVK